ncbi:MAG: hypothetical protein AB1489_09240 [Acidobacteriota bacterium]
MISFRTRLPVILLALMIGLSSTLILPVQAGNKKSGELKPSGTVMVNGAAVASNVTVLTDSRIVTMGNSGAVANLGATGQLFVGENTDLMLTFADTWVRIELSYGTVRVQNGSQSIAWVITKTCVRVEVINGSVKILNDNNKDEEALKVGESKEFLDKNGITSNTIDYPVDYRVSTIDCLVAATPRAKPSRRGLLFALFGGGGAAGALGGLLGGGDPTPASPFRP